MSSCEQLHARWTLGCLSSLIMNSGFGYFGLTMPPLSSHCKDWPDPGVQKWKVQTEREASCVYAKQRLRRVLFLEAKTGSDTVERSHRLRSRQKVLIQVARVQYQGNLAACGDERGSHFSPRLSAQRRGQILGGVCWLNQKIGLRECCTSS